MERAEAKTRDTKGLELSDWGPAARQLTGSRDEYASAA